MTRQTRRELQRAVQNVNEAIADAQTITDGLGLHLTVQGVETHDEFRTEDGEYRMFATINVSGPQSASTIIDAVRFYGFFPYRCQLLHFDPERSQLVYRVNLFYADEPLDPAFSSCISAHHTPGIAHYEVSLDE